MTIDELLVTIDAFDKSKLNIVMDLNRICCRLDGHNYSIVSGIFELLGRKAYSGNTELTCTMHGMSQEDARKVFLATCSKEEKDNLLLRKTFLNIFNLEERE